MAQNQPFDGPSPSSSAPGSVLLISSGQADYSASNRLLKEQAVTLDLRISFSEAKSDFRIDAILICSFGASFIWSIPKFGRIPEGLTTLLLSTKPLKVSMAIQAYELELLKLLGVTLSIDAHTLIPGHIDQSKLHFAGFPAQSLIEAPPTSNLGLNLKTDFARHFDPQYPNSSRNNASQFGLAYAANVATARLSDFFRSDEADSFFRSAAPSLATFMPKQFNHGVESTSSLKAHHKTQQQLPMAQLFSKLNAAHSSSEPTKSTSLGSLVASPPQIPIPSTQNEENEKTVSEHSIHLSNPPQGPKMTEYNLLRSLLRMWELPLPKVRLEQENDGIWSATLLVQHFPPSTGENSDVNVALDLAAADMFRYFKATLLNSNSLIALPPVFPPVLPPSALYPPLPLLPSSKTQILDAVFSQEKQNDFLSSSAPSPDDKPSDVVVEANLVPDLVEEVSSEASEPEEEPKIENPSYSGLLLPSWADRVVIGVDPAVASSSSGDLAASSSSASVIPTSLNPPSEELPLSLSPMEPICFRQLCQLQEALDYAKPFVRLSLTPSPILLENGTSLASTTPALALGTFRVRWNASVTLNHWNPTLSSNGTASSLSQALECAATNLAIQFWQSLKTHISAIPALEHWEKPPTRPKPAELAKTAEMALAHWDTVLTQLMARLKVPKLGITTSINAKGVWRFMTRDPVKDAPVAATDVNPEVALAKLAGEILGKPITVHSHK